MKNKNFKDMVIFVAIFSLVIFFSSTALAGGSFTFKWGKDSESGQEQVKSKSKHKKGGPPAHAPAHGYRAKHKYRYYPSDNVYEDLKTESIFT